MEPFYADVGLSTPDRQNNACLELQQTVLVAAAAPQVLYSAWAALAYFLIICKSVGLHVRYAHDKICSAGSNSAGNNILLHSGQAYGAYLSLN